MKTILMVLAEQKFRDIEYITPRAFFEQAGIQVVTSSTAKESVGRFGYKVSNQLLNSEINVADYDALFMVGGIGSLQYLEDDTLKDVTKQFLAQLKPVAAICAAPRNLVNWGLLTGQNVTAHNGDGSFAAFALAHGAIPKVEETVVEAGLILTGNGPEASEALALALLKRL